MRRCIRCTQWKEESEFNIRNEERGYLQSVCRSCQQQDSRDRYANDKESVKMSNRTSRIKARDQAKKFVQEYLSATSCADCGETDIEVLTFDHLKDKRMNISDMVSQGYGVRSIRDEIGKTEVTCFNCHMRRERRRRNST